MSDQFILTDLGEDYVRYRREALKRERREAALRPANKAAVFAALAAAGVTHVEVLFDGAGDSGQIESIQARDANGDVDLPVQMIPYAQAAWSGSEVETILLSVRDAIEALAYDLLRHSHAGWENNEGAYGTFTFDVADLSLRLAYNERFIETELSEHDF